MLKSGKSPAACQVEPEVSSTADTEFPLYVYLATAGLLYFRLGKVETGRHFYTRAEAAAPAERRVRVAIYRAREELHANTEIAAAQVARARTLNIDAESKVNSRMLELLETQLKAFHSQSSDGFYPSISADACRRSLPLLVNATPEIKDD